jgi:hypothetical protein
MKCINIMQGPNLIRPQLRNINGDLFQTNKKKRRKKDGLNYERSKYNEIWKVSKLKALITNVQNRMRYGKSLI